MAVPKSVLSAADEIGAAYENNKRLANAVAKTGKVIRKDLEKITSKIEADEDGSRIVKGSNYEVGFISVKPSPVVNEAKVAAVLSSHNLQRVTKVVKTIDPDALAMLCRKGVITRKQFAAMFDYPQGPQRIHIRNLKSKKQKDRLDEIEAE